MTRGVSEFDVSGEGVQFLTDLLALAFTKKFPREGVTLWYNWREWGADDTSPPQLGFDLYSPKIHEPPSGWNALPGGVDHGAAAAMCMAWLSVQDYGRVDTDGSANKGWRFKAGQRTGEPHFLVSPQWAVYGK